MRYVNEKTGDWVEIKGAADLSMRELRQLYDAGAMDAAIALAKAVVVDWSYTLKGQPVTVGDIDGLPPRGWDWLRQCIMDATRDEALDPEV